VRNGEIIIILVKHNSRHYLLARGPRGAIARYIVFVLKNIYYSLVEQPTPVFEQTKRLVKKRDKKYYVYYNYAGFREIVLYLQTEFVEYSYFYTFCDFTRIIYTNKRTLYTVSLLLLLLLFLPPPSRRPRNSALYGRYDIDAFSILSFVLNALDTERDEAVYRFYNNLVVPSPSPLLLLLFRPSTRIFV